ncbi:MAG: Glycosyl transferase family 2 [Candidatus Roizmanbacteria bacterium GW2011_GWA2_37_7]|uniref:Glycosyl transferase family 2 n=1 Tax=Candidatus Roizmanbacteria bacterium GW2011_GWA2_37_7 TaxID=1618481 RepID=A0A0G0JPK4_9BACT|nr:MAG: Glycosyl transferase family 2 [Candidatus Roizmanbacteria bacterium GW2011_GWA2_37_7]
MKRASITAIIPAHNEEKNIERCIKSVSWCDKVQILWMGDDRTGKMAKSLGAYVIELNKSKESNFLKVQKNINCVINHATTDWMLRIDADEVVTEELKQEIQRILSTNNHILTTDFPVAFGIPRQQYFMGDFLKGGDWAYDRLVRLFQPKYARYEPIVAVHEQFRVHGTIGYLKSPLLHYSHPTLKDAINKFNIYTTMEAKQLKDGFLIAFLKFIFLPWYIFARWMIWHKGYKDGARGVIAGFLRGFYDFLLYAKYILLCSEKSHSSP